MIVINALSSLLVIHEDKSLSFFHKSVRDWLVDNTQHNYCVNVQYGHKILFDLCVKKLNDVKEKGVSEENLAFPDVEYALKYCIPHMLKGLQDARKLESFLSDFFTDLEVVFAGVCVNVNLALYNLKSLKSPPISTCVSGNTRTIVEKLYFLIRKFVFSLGQHPQTFLQDVVNEAGEPQEPLCLKATKLLETRYGDIFYFQLNNQVGIKRATEMSCILSGIITGIDISPKHDFVVCSYREGGVELFSLTTGMSEWKIQNYTVQLRGYLTRNILMLPHCIVFHPRQNLILPGRLDKVLTLQGTFTNGPFDCDLESSAFNNCCFSLDGSKMVTNHFNTLTVWDVVSGTKEKDISCKTLYSFSFTASGNFLGTADSENVFSVYDITNNYEVSSIQLHNSEDAVEIISSFEQNSWLCVVDCSFRCMNHDLILSPDLVSYNDIILPGNLHSSDELQCFLQNPERSWMSKIRRNIYNASLWSKLDAARYFLLSNGSVLVFSCRTYVMRIFNVDSLMHTKEFAPYNFDGLYLDISINGDFVYACGTQRFTVWKLEDKCSRSCQLPNRVRFLPVRGGIISYKCIFAGPAATPELWNSDITKRLACFDQLAGARKLLPVSDEIIAVIYPKERVVFFNVFTNQIVHEMFFIQPDFSVLTCSINYYALVKCRGKIFLFKDGLTIDDWTKMFSKAALRDINGAEFSPGGNRLAISCFIVDKIFTFDVASITMLPQISIHGKCTDLKFYDEENLICGSKNQMIYLINVERGEILTCLDVGDAPDPICVCRKLNIVCVGLKRSKRFEILKIFSPR